MLARRSAIAAGCRRQELDIVKIDQQVGRCAAIGAVIAAVRSSPVHTVAEAGPRLPRLDDHAAAVGVHGPHVQDAGHARPVIDRHRGQARMHVARDWVERIEGDDIAHLGAEIIDLVDQADGADHARQSNRDDSEEDGACTAGVSVICAHRRARPLCCLPTDYRRRWFTIDEVIWQKQLVKSRIKRKRRRRSAAKGMGRSPRERQERVEPANLTPRRMRHQAARDIDPDQIRRI